MRNEQNAQFHTFNNLLVPAQRPMKTGQSILKNERYEIHSPTTKLNDINLGKNEKIAKGKESLNKKGKTSKKELKILHLVKRKQEESKIMGLRRIDHQKLETVMEEGQSLGEELVWTEKLDEQSKFCISSGEESDENSEYGKRVLTRAYNMLSVAELLDSGPDDEKQNLKPPNIEENQDPGVNNEVKSPVVPKSPEPQDLLKTTGGISFDADEEPDAVKKNLSFSEIMDVFPMFSNENFGHSRDTISVESEDIEAGDKSETFLEKVDVIEVNYTKEDGSDRNHVENRQVIETIIESQTTIQVSEVSEGSEGSEEKETKEKKMQHKIRKNRKDLSSTSSPFTDFLLLLSPFAEEREKNVKTKPNTAKEETQTEEKQGMLCAIECVVAEVMKKSVVEVCLYML